MNFSEIRNICQWLRFISTQPVTALSQQDLCIVCNLKLKRMIQNISKASTTTIIMIHDYVAK